MFEISEEILEEYANLAVKVGANVQAGQTVNIGCPVNAYKLARKCAEVAYKDCKAGKVIIDYYDDDKSRLDYIYMSKEALSNFPKWQVDKRKELIDEGYCRISIIGSDPDLLKGLDQEKIKASRMSMMKATSDLQYYFMNSVGQWTIVAYPELNWAKKVFPDLSDDDALSALWSAILKTSRVKLGSTVSNWESHDKELSNHCKLLNEYNFKSLHFKNSLGTDLSVGLITNHIWQGGSEKASGKYPVYFNANIPTEEVFTMPNRYHIDGKVYSTKPLSYGGKIISSFNLTFKDGKVVDYSAKDNEDVLKSILDTDEGSKSLGEVALISYDSPISNSGILFYDTLFDENASCHLALGACYPTTVKDGEKLTSEELLKLGGNDSLNHVDFMFGSKDMSIVGETYDGEHIEVFKDGNFVF